MTDLPYTDADLRAEAARQHAALTQDPDFMGVGEQMEGRRIPSTDDGLGGTGWDGLPNEHYDEAQRKIHNLITGAANVSAWAVDLGVGGLTPQATHGWVSTTGGWDVAVQIATSRELTEAARTELVAEIRTALDEVVGRVLGATVIGRRGGKTD